MSRRRAVSVCVLGLFTLVGCRMDNPLFGAGDEVAGESESSDSKPSTTDATSDNSTADTADTTTGPGDGDGEAETQTEPGDGDGDDSGSDSDSDSAEVTTDTGLGETETGESDECESLSGPLMSPCSWETAAEDCPPNWGCVLVNDLGLPIEATPGYCTPNCETEEQCSWAQGQCSNPNFSCEAGGVNEFFACVLSCDVPEDCYPGQACSPTGLCYPLP